MDELIFLSLVVGLVFGSFLNVVIHRIPVMMQDELSIHNGESHGKNLSVVPYNLIWPTSHCPSCFHSVKGFENIPILGYLFLRGHCSACDCKIPMRYPVVEFLAAIITVWIYYRFGFSLDGFAALILGYSLICLSFIDLEHQLLPDCITIPFIWLGLVFSLFNVFTDSHSSIIGAVTGYVFLWLIFHIFLWITGKEGMGYGDFKLLAMLGSWLGWELLPQIILVSSLTGIIAAFILMLVNRHKSGDPLSFGPFLSFAGWISLVFDHDLLLVSS